MKGWWLLAWGEIEMDPPGVGLFILRKTKRGLFSGIYFGGCVEVHSSPFRGSLLCIRRSSNCQH